VRGRTLADRLANLCGWPGKASRAVMSCRPVQASYGTAGFRQPRRTRSRAFVRYLGQGPGPRGGSSVDVSGSKWSRFRTAKPVPTFAGTAPRRYRGPLAGLPNPRSAAGPAGYPGPPALSLNRGLRSGRSFTRPARHTGQARGITPSRHDLRRLQTAPFPHGEVTGVCGEGRWVGIRGMKKTQKNRLRPGLVPGPTVIASLARRLISDG
jgi:hypothetical protein